MAHYTRCLLYCSSTDNFTFSAFNLDREVYKCRQFFLKERKGFSKIYPGCLNKSRVNSCSLRKRKNRRRENNFKLNNGWIQIYIKEIPAPPNNRGECCPGARF